MTLRSIRVLKEVDYILAEDTRVTGKLLSHLQINQKMKPYHIHNEHKFLESVILDLEKGTSIALVSDAGMPAISDPGFLLVRECMKRDIEVNVLPGATAFLLALVKSGFPTDRFVFEGFLPHKKGRVSKLSEIKDEERTVIFYESPHRLIKFFQQFNEVVGSNRLLSVSRELTKKFEETVNGTAPELMEYFEKNPVKGEFVICVKGKEE